MKRKPNSLSSRSGFTLVELLVVVLIIAALAAVAFTMGPRMKKRGDAAKSIQNMRQIGATMGVYAADNSLCFPPPEVGLKDPSTGTTTRGDIWHVALLKLTYPDVDPAKFGDKVWWEANKPFFRNPLMTATSKPKPFQPWFNGYAINMQINTNLSGPGDDYENGAKTIPIPLGRISEPSRTPLVAPYNLNWNFTAGSFTKVESMKVMAVEGRFPVLFVDGHVESMPPQEYIDRKLASMPKK